MKFLHKVVSVLLSLIHYPVFGLLLMIFHPIQWLCLKLGGYQAHKISVDWLNFFLSYSLLLLGSGHRFKFESELPQGKSLIFVSNHQSMYDIPPMIWKFRKHHPKFVAKKELQHGIPSVSFNLRHGGAALIDRKNPEQAIAELKRFTDHLRAYKWSAVIFPEGTRSRDGVPKKFAVGGLKTLTEKLPDALLVPVSINHSWKLVQYGMFPLSAFVWIDFYVHTPITVNDKPFEECYAEVEKTVKSRLLKA